MFYKFDTKEEADEFVDFEIGSYTYEALQCNCDGELILCNGRKIWNLETFNKKRIVIIDSK